LFKETAAEERCRSSAAIIKVAKWGAGEYE